jgi:hypothetical protein
MRRDGSKEAWFQAEIDRRYCNAHTKRIIEPGFEFLESEARFIIRRKRRFRWSGRDIENSIAQFKTYHKQIRRRVIPIYSSENRWYLKKSVAGSDKLINSQLVLHVCRYAQAKRVEQIRPNSIRAALQRQPQLASFRVHPHGTRSVRVRHGIRNHGA